jgi:MFS family permease
VLLTAATLAWTAGAWLQERRGHVRGRATFVQRGLAFLVLGSAVSASVLIDAVPIVVSGIGWTVAGLGMGLSYSGLSLIVLSAAPPGKEGSATSALQLSDVLGMAVGTGLGGAAVAFGERAGMSPRPGVAVAFGLALAAGLLASAAARRLPRESGRESDTEDRKIAS